LKLADWQGVRTTIVSRACQASLIFKQEQNGLWRCVISPGSEVGSDNTGLEPGPPTVSRPLTTLQQRPSFPPRIPLRSCEQRKATREPDPACSSLLQTFSWMLSPGGRVYCHRGSGSCGHSVNIKLLKNYFDFCHFMIKA
jgi:hypothetical protein